MILGLAEMSMAKKRPPSSGGTHGNCFPYQLRSQVTTTQSGNKVGKFTSSNWVGSMGSARARNGGLNYRSLQDDSIHR